MVETYKKVQEIVLSFSGVKVKKSTNQLTYKDKYQSILHLRKYDEKVTIAFAKGAQLQKDYPFLEGDGSVVRHWNLYTVDDLDEGFLREMIQESMILNVEHYEMKKMRKKL